MFVNLYTTLSLVLSCHLLVVNNCMIEFLSIFTPTAYASVDTFIRKVNTYVINPAIRFMIILAVVFFIIGVVQYIRGASNEDARKKGQQHMLWGLIGLFIMVGVFFIMKVLLGTVGIEEDQINPQTGEVNIDLLDGN